MTRQELLQRVGEAAIREAKARRELEHSEGHGQTQQARKDRAAFSDAQRALRALTDEAEQRGE